MEYFPNPSYIPRYEVITCPTLFSGLEARRGSFGRIRHFLAISLVPLAPGSLFCTCSLACSPPWLLFALRFLSSSEKIARHLLLSFSSHSAQIAVDSYLWVRNLHLILVISLFPLTSINTFRISTSLHVLSFPTLILIFQNLSTRTINAYLSLNSSKVRSSPPLIGHVLPTFIRGSVIPVQTPSTSSLNLIPVVLIRLIKTLSFLLFHAFFSNPYSPSFIASGLVSPCPIFSLPGPLPSLLCCAATIVVCSYLCSLSSSPNTRSFPCCLFIAWLFFSLCPLSLAFFISLSFFSILCLCSRNLSSNYYSRYSIFLSQSSATIFIIFFKLITIPASPFNCPTSSVILSFSFSISFFPSSAVVHSLLCPLLVT